MANYKTCRNMVLRILRRMGEFFGIEKWSHPALDTMDKRIAAYLPKKNGGFFVEAGAHNGYAQSNTYYLARFHGWRGVLVEPVPEQFRQCVLERPESHVYQRFLVDFDYKGQKTTMFSLSLLSRQEGSKTAEEEDALISRGRYLERGVTGKRISVPVATLTAVLDEAGVKNIDFLSLDVEGGEPAVLRGLDFARYYPQVILVEANKPDEVRDILQRHHYREIEHFGTNDLLFVCNEIEGNV